MGTPGTLPQWGPDGATLTDSVAFVDENGCLHVNACFVAEDGADVGQLTLTLGPLPSAPAPGSAKLVVLSDGTPILMMPDGTYRVLQGYIPGPAFPEGAVAKGGPAQGLLVPSRITDSGAGAVGVAGPISADWVALEVGEPPSPSPGQTLLWADDLGGDLWATLSDGTEVPMGGLQPDLNLFDLEDVVAARDNLGLGTAALADASDFAPAGETGVDTGAIMAWGCATPPAGWLLCDGSAVSRATYADLFACIGTTYGPGDGSTTFNLPDFRGREPMGAGTGTGLTPRSLGQSGGSETTTATISTLPTHDHSGV